MKPWYQKGLCFTCTECGKCCTGDPGYVWVSSEEIEKMAAFLKISVEKFVRVYTRQVDGKLSLKERLDTYACTLLQDGKCRVYEARPTQCRTFPFWPENLESEKAWATVAQRCEGINHKRAATIPLSVITENLKEMDD